MEALIKGKKIYFISDAHLGIPDHASSLEREKKLVAWLEMAKTDAAAIYLLGDIFDFWFEYKTVVPRGYTRLFGQIAAITDSGIPMYYFTGNHDMWAFNYFEKELNVKIIRKPVVKIINGLKFYIGHGDGLGPKDYGYKFIKKVFANKVCQWLFARLHPNFAIGLALFFSRRSRYVNEKTDLVFHGEDKERLIIYAKEYLKKETIDYFIFGHRHIPLCLKIAEASTFVNLGDWMNHFSYAVFDGEKVEVKYF